MGCCKDCGNESCNHKLLGLCYNECSAWVPDIASNVNEKTTINEDKKTAVKTNMVEIVRCKDCVSGVPHKLPDGRKVVVCTNVFAFADMGHDPNFYCKEGENK